MDSVKDTNDEMMWGLNTLVFQSIVLLSPVKQCQLLKTQYYIKLILYF